MKIVEFINFLDKKNIKLSIESGNIKVTGEKELITDELKAIVQSNKEVIIEFLKTVESKDGKSIPVAVKKEYYPLSSAQKRLFILKQIDEDSIVYNLPGAYLIEGVIDKERIEEAFRQLIKRHETLRTSFEVIEDEPVQRVHEYVDFKLEYMEEEEARVAERIKGLIRPFDLTQAPLIRIALIKIKEQRFILFYDMHHIVSDGTSLQIMVKEFIQIYSGVVHTQALPELRIQYKDFTVWQSELFQSSGIKGQEEYWLKTFNGEPPALNLPTDYPRPSMQDFSGDRVFFEAGVELAKRLRTLGGEIGATLFMVLLTAYNILLAKYSGQEDIIVGSPIAGRHHAGLEFIIGMFVNTLALRNFPVETKTFRQLLGEVKENSIKAYDNQDYQFEELVEKLKLRRDLSRNPIFDVMLVFHNIDMSGTTLPGLTIKPYEFANKVSKFDLTLEVTQAGQNILFNLEYSAKLFRRESILRLSGHFINILNKITTHPELKISDIEMISEEEQRRILVDFNATAAEYPREKTIHQLFEEQEQRTPENIALVYGDACRRSLTYREVNQKANRLARRLRKSGIKINDMVALILKRSPEMIIAILGILKAGGAYLPIDPEYPPDRIYYILKDSAAKALITHEDLKNGIQFDGHILDVNDIENNEFDSSNLEIVSKPRDLAYVIYTSGSTGKPKGVMDEHISVVNVLTALQRKYPLLEPDAYLFKTAYTFDVSVSELFGWHLAGGRLVILENGLEKDPQMLIGAIKENDITHVNFVPSMLNALLSAVEEGELKAAGNLKYVFVAGEAISGELVRKFRNLAPDVTFENFYGPTEATIYATGYSLSEYQDQINVPIGKPLSNIKTYILSQSHKPQPVGITGELYIAGDGLARGYLNRPELTADRFIPDPFFEVDASQGTRLQRMYRTGDLARWLPDGNIEFLGRIDHQVKIRGFRIELGEIENQLLRHEFIREAVVVANEDREGNKNLCAYLVAGKKLTIRELREYLSRELPDYMIPSYFILLDKFPLTPSGKIDRKALPKPDGNVNIGGEYQAPVTKTEKELAHIWQDVLGVAKIGIYDKFFELGGDSLKCIQVASQAKKIGIDITIKQIFQYPTIAKLANLAGQIKIHAEQTPVTGPAPMNYYQYVFFHYYKYWSNRNRYNILAGFEIAREIVDLKKLERVALELINHHDVLRMRFIDRACANPPDWQPYIDEPYTESPFVNVDLSYLMDQEPEFIDKVLNNTAEELHNSLNLTQGPLFRLVLLDLGSRYPCLAGLIVHHTVCDQISLNILIEDLKNAYQELIADRAISLPAKTTSFKEWAHRLILYSRSPELLHEAEYWLNLPYEEIVPLSLKLCREPKKWMAKSFAMTAEETDILINQIPKSFRTDVLTILLTAMTQSVTNWNGAKVLPVTSSDSARNLLPDADIDLSRTVGPFVMDNSLMLLRRSEEKEPAKMLNSMLGQLQGIPNRGRGFGILTTISKDGPVKQKLSTILTDLHRKGAMTALNYLGITAPPPRKEEPLNNTAAPPPQKEDSSHNMAAQPLSMEGSTNNAMENYRRILTENAYPEYDPIIALWVTAQVYEGRLLISIQTRGSVSEMDTFEKMAEDFLRILQEIAGVV